MTGEVIKSFLVGLGFDVDETTLKKFNQSVAEASLKVAALGAAITASATAIGKGITDVSKDFEQMGYEYRIIAPAINKALSLRNELLKAYSAAGINITKVVLQSVKLNFSLDKTRFAFKAIYDSVASKFFPLLTKQSDLFRAKIYANLPKIQASLEKFVTFIFKALDAVVELGTRLWSILGRVWDFFVTLDKATSGWSTIILGVIAAWDLLNLSFLATPLGALIAGLTTLLALYDDFKTFEEGGKSLFNWGPVIPYIDAITQGVQNLIATFRSALDVVLDLVLALFRLTHLDFSGMVDSLKDVGGDLMGVFKNATAGFSGNVAANLQNNPASGPIANPLGAGTNVSSTNQNVQQQTNINIQGSADAQSTGQAVASQQTNVNRDMTRNLKGATR